VTGIVICYMPATRRGVLRSDAGHTLPFLIPESGCDLQGGDIVEYEAAAGSSRPARIVTLRRRWALLLNEEHRCLVNEFHDTVAIGR
jgi:hypothetical protein